MSSRKIFIDATGIGVTPTGLGKYCSCLLKAIAENKDYHFHMTILHQRSLPSNHDLFSLPGKRMTFLPCDMPVVGPKRDVLVFTALRHAINKHDIYHCLSSYLPAFGIGIPSIVTIHDLKYIMFPELFDNWFKANYYEWIIRRGAARATRIIAVSAATRNDLMSLGISPEKISVIHEASTISQKRSPLCELPAFPVREPFFLYVGDSRPHKNILKILQAYRSLLLKMDNKCPPFVFVGSNIETSYRSQADLPTHKVFFLGPASDDQLVYLYKNALALVYPSLYEGFGLPILEAMSVGTPVITSNRSAMSEVAGKAALLVDPSSPGEISEAMNRLKEDSFLRKRLRTLGMRRAHDYSWKKTAAQTLMLYQITSA